MECQNITSIFQRKTHRMSAYMSDRMPDIMSEYVSGRMCISWWDSLEESIFLMAHLNFHAMSG